MTAILNFTNNAMSRELVVLKNPKIDSTTVYSVEYDNNLLFDLCKNGGHLKLYPQNKSRVFFGHSIYNIGRT